MVRLLHMDTEKQRLKEILQEKSIMRGVFTLASGKKSDYYIDARLTTLDAEGVYLVGIARLTFVGQANGTKLQRSVFDAISYTCGSCCQRFLRFVDTNLGMTKGKLPPAPLNVGTEHCSVL